jgi:hypothetical protein
MLEQSIFERIEVCKNCISLKSIVLTNFLHVCYEHYFDA